MVLSPRSPGRLSVSRSACLRALQDPVAIFLVLSAIVGAIVMVLNPPLRGPDELAHFLRVYGVARGDVVPSTTDEKGRKGVFLPARLSEDMRYFESSRREREGGRFAYPQLMEGFRQQRAAVPTTETRPDVFQFYEGAESYSPASYLPYIIGYWVSEAAGLEFFATLQVMRIAGFLAATATAAYAIAIVPHLKWTFLLIAMLPAALYARTVVSTDGVALGTVLVVTALCLRSSQQSDGGGQVKRRALWMLWCVLTKPPHAAFVVLEAMTRPVRKLPSQWLSVAFVTLPGVILTAVWVVAVSGDAGTWRIMGSDQARADLFDPVKKLWFLLEHPLQFPKLVIASVVDDGSNLWRQLIGVLGWLDTPLRTWIYPVVTVLLVAGLVGSCPIDTKTRFRVAAVATLATVGYVLAVYATFYLSWTALDAEKVWGVQGRYFIVALPPLAVAIAAGLRRGLGEHARACIAVASALVSGGAVIEAIIRVQW